MVVSPSPSLSVSYGERVGRLTKLEIRIKDAISESARKCGAKTENGFTFSAPGSWAGFSGELEARFQQIISEINPQEKSKRWVFKKRTQ